MRFSLHTREEKFHMHAYEHIQQSVWRCRGVMRDEEVKSVAEDVDRVFSQSVEQFSLGQNDALDK